MPIVDEKINAKDEIIKAVHQLDHVSTTRRESTTANELYCRIMAILEKLPERQKQVIGYRYLYHFSRKRIAEKMGITIRTVHNTKVAAEQSIRQMIMEGM